MDEVVQHTPVRNGVRLALLVLAGLAVRLLVAPWTAGHGYDVQTFNNWAQTMHDHPLGQFYALASYPDHLPGDLWFFNALQHLFSLVGCPLDGRFDMAVRLVPVAADACLIVFAYLLPRRLGCRGWWTCLWVALSPAFIAASAIWGQWDSVSAALLLCGAWLVARGGWSFVAAGPALAWAVLIKPDLVVPASALGVVVLVAGVRRRQWAQVAGFAVAGVAWAYALTAPFRVGLLWTPTGGWSLLDRISYAADRWPYTRMGADNVWAFGAHPQLRGTSDLQTAFGLTYAHLGTYAAALVGICVLIALALLWRRGALTAAEAVLWATASILYAMFWLMTRVHERYEFPVVLAIVLLAGLVGDRRTKVLAVAVTGVFMANLHIAIAVLKNLTVPHGSWLVVALLLGLALTVVGARWFALAIAAISIAISEAHVAWPLPSNTPARIDAAAQGLVLVVVLTWPWWRERRGDRATESPLAT